MAINNATAEKIAETQTAPIDAPSAGEKIVISVKPGTVVDLAFGLGEAKASVDGPNLVLSFDNGGKIVLLNFFPGAGEASENALHTPDGDIPAGQLMATLLNLDSLQTAEGPGNNPGPNLPHSGAAYTKYALEFSLPGVRGINEGGNGDNGGNGGDNFPFLGSPRNLADQTGTPVTPAEPQPLFTENDDTVDFNSVTLGSYIDGTQYDALAGNDNVILPNNAAAAANAGFDGLVFHGGAGNDTITGGSRGEEIHGDAGDDTIHGIGGNDTIFGGEGNDTLYGDAGSDTIHGGNGNDIIDGGADSDTLYGDAGNDTVSGGDGDDSIDGGSGDDILSGDAGNDTIHGGADNDTINGGDGNDMLFGDEGNDVIHGGADNDNVDGGSGDDLVYGDAGNDTLFGGEGADLLDGGEGDDTLKFSADEVRATAHYEVPDHFIVEPLVHVYPTSINDQEVTIPVNLIPPPAPNDYPYDKVYAVSYDRFVGGSGVDTLLGTANNDWIRLDADGDPLAPGQAAGPRIVGIEVIDAGAGDDFVDLSGKYVYGDVTIHGGEGNDFIISSAGNDTITGDAGDDVIHAGAGNDNVDGGAGNDLLFGGEGNDTMTGGEGNDYLDGGNGDDSLSGGNGNDTINGGEGNDSIDGGSGNDTLNGGLGDDTMHGGLGNDVMHGNEGNDLMFGGDGDDVIYGDLGYDTIYGGAGNDLLYAGANGGAGASLTVDSGNWNDPADFVTITGGQTVSGGSLAMFAAALNSTMPYQGGGFHGPIPGSPPEGPINQTMPYQPGGDHMPFPFPAADASNQVVFEFSQAVNSGQITVSGLYSDSVEQGFWQVYQNGVAIAQGFFNGTDGSPLTFHIGFTFDKLVLSAVPTTDTFALGAHAGYTIESANFTAAGFGDKLYGEAGNDTLTGSYGDDYLDGGAGHDTIYGGGGNDTIHGGSGTNLLSGGAGNDTIYADDGKGIISGDAGSDTIVLGSGQSTLVWGVYDMNGGAVDDVFNFETGQDKLNIKALLSGYSNANMSDFVRFVDSGSNTYMQVDTNGAVGGHNWQNVALLHGVTLGGGGIKYSDLITH